MLKNIWFYNHIPLCTDSDVQSAKWIAGKRKQPQPGHLLMLSLCGRVIEGVRDVNIERRNGFNYFANKYLECNHVRVG